MRGQAGFWDIDERYARLSAAGDPLEKLDTLVPWEVFRGARAFVEHVFAHQKAHMGLFNRTIGIGRARMKIGMANLAHYLTRYVWHEGRSAPA